MSIKNTISVDPGSVVTEEDSWWIDYTVTCQCGTTVKLEEYTEVYIRYQDEDGKSRTTLSVPCTARKCPRHIWVTQTEVEAFKKQQEIDKSVAEAKAKAVPDA